MRSNAISSPFSLMRCSILNPKPSSKTEKQKIQEIMKQVQENGLKPEEIAERLGITITM